MHVRKQIRDAAIVLLGGLLTTGTRVYAGRTRNLGEAHDPALLIYAIEEVAVTDATGLVTDGRELTLAIEGRVAGPDIPDDTLDQIAAEVETRIGEAQRFGGLAVAVNLAATRITTIAPGANQIGEITLEYRVQYRTREGAPTVSV